MKRGKRLECPGVTPRVARGQGSPLLGAPRTAPLSGQKKDLIEKSMSKQKPVHNPTADPLSQSLTVKGGERPEGGSGKGLKVIQV